MPPPPAALTFRLTVAWIVWTPSFALKVMSWLKVLVGRPVMKPEVASSVIPGGSWSTPKVSGPSAFAVTMRAMYSAFVLPVGSASVRKRNAPFAPRSQVVTPARTGAAAAAARTASRRTRASAGHRGMDGPPGLRDRRPVPASGGSPRGATEGRRTRRSCAGGGCGSVRPVSPEGLPRARYAAFLLGTASWFLAWGLQAVIFPWLVVTELRESPERVGLAQTVALLPALPLLLLGGALGDRREPSRLLAALHVVLAAVFAALAALVAAGGLSYARFLAFAFATGALNALQVPARDAQLYPVARNALSRGVVGANLVGQLGQAAGGVAGAWLSALGAPAVLLVQAVLALAGAAPSAWLRGGAPARAPVAGAPAARPVLRGIASDLRLAFASPALRPVLLLTACVGLLFVGPYGVVLPLLVRDVYGGGPREMGLLVSMLPLGGILGGLALFARGGLRRNGRALLLGQGFAALCMASLALAPPFAGACAAVLGWGVGSAFFLSAGRTLFHLGAPPAQRATLLGVYSLGILGAGPLGSLLSGVEVAAVGPHAALGLHAGAMLACVGLAAAQGGLLAREGRLPSRDPRPERP